MPEHPPANHAARPAPLPTPAHEPRPYRWPAAVGELVVITCFGAFVLAGLALITGILWVLAPVFGILFALMSVFMLIAAGAGFARYQATRGNLLLNYLHAAVRLNLPLADYLGQVARGERGRLRREARKVATHLSHGYGLGETLMSVRTEIPRHHAAVIWRGEACGRLVQAFNRIDHHQRRRREQTPASDLGIGALGYAMLVMVVVILLTTGISILIIPTFEEIAADFGTQLPRITTLTFAWVAWLGPIVCLLMALVLLLMVGWPTHRGLVGGRGLIDALRRWLEPLYWRLPVISAGHRSRACGDCCFLIEQAMHAGLPLDEAVDNASAPAISAVMHRKMKLFAWGLTSGSDPADAARDAHMPALIVGMLATAEHSDDPAACFGFLARYYDQKTSPLEAALRASALPLVTLLLAGVTGWLVFAIFYPLVMLIEQTNAVTGYY